MDEKREPTRKEPPATRDTPALALTPRVYVLLALLILTYALPPLLRRIVPVLAHPHHATAEGELSDQDFERYLSAESSVRIGFYFRDSSFGQGQSGTHSPHSHTKTASPVSAFGRVEDFGDAVSDYRTLSRTTHAPNMDRRVLILTHALGKPFDEKALGALTENLKLAKTPNRDIAAETALWRTLYAPNAEKTETAPAVLPASGVPIAEARLRGMELRFLQDRALADLYQRAEQPTAQKASLERLHALAQRTFAKYALQIATVGLAGLLGLGLLIFFVVAASGQNWPLVRRVATANTRLRWGTLIECFLFYLAFYRFLGFIIGMLLTASDWQPDAHQALFLSAGLQIGTGAVAVFYVRWQARRNGTSLDSIGLTGRGNLLGNIGYGILGYCATLPLLFIAGMAAKAIFRHNTNTTPNPVLPLMVGTHDPLSRALIFLMASIAAPFFEELFFRGVLFTALRLRWGWVVSAVISGLCFALVHPMQDWLPIFVMGFTFATMREMRQSLVPSMTAHFLQNTLSFLMLSSLFST